MKCSYSIIFPFGFRFSNFAPTIMKLCKCSLSDNNYQNFQFISQSALKTRDFFFVSKLETFSWPISHSRRTISPNLCSNPSNETILVPPPPRISTQTLSFFLRFRLSFIFLNFIIAKYARYERSFQKNTI